MRVKNYLGWIKKHAASGACAKKVKAKIDMARYVTFIFFIFFAGLVILVIW